MTTYPLTVQASTYTIPFRCLASGSGLLTQLSCNNVQGSGNIIYTGLSIPIGSGVYGISGTCHYTGYATYTPVCMVENTTTTDCTTNVVLSS